MGAALQELKRFDEAETEFNSALKLDPQSVYALDHLAQVYSAERRYALAIEKWNLAIHLASTDPDLQMELAVAYSNNGNSKRAIEILRDLIRSAPNLALAHFNLATVYADAKRFREAADEYKAALTVEPGMAPPEESFTTPVITPSAACASAAEGTSSAATSATAYITLRNIRSPSGLCNVVQGLGRRRSPDRPQRFLKPNRSVTPAVR